MATETALRIIDTPAGIEVEGYSKNPGDTQSAANAVLHYVMRHWDDIVRAAVLFERTGAIANVPVDKAKESPFTVKQPTHASLDVLTAPQSYMAPSMASDAREFITPAPAEFVSGQGGDFGGGGASSSWSDSGSSRDSDARSSYDSGSSYSDSGSSSSDSGSSSFSD